MRRQLLTLTTAVLVASPIAAPGAAAKLRFRNPLRDPGGHPVSCPDPSVIDVPRGQFRYFMACTSDMAENAFPIWKSKDLVHWQRSGSVFPGRGHPWWALAPGPAGGKYWGPEINRIRARWVIYFAASYDQSRVNLRFPDGSRVPARQHVIGVATAERLAGPWQTHLLHYRGQYNGV